METRTKRGLALLLAVFAVVAGVGASGIDAAPVDDTTEPLSAGRASYTRATETFIADSFCLPDLTVQSLGTIFDAEPGGIIGADYPRTLALENGNVLWTFQDARIRTPTGRALRPQHRDAPSRSMLQHPRRRQQQPSRGVALPR